MSNNITVNSGDTLIKIVKREYGLTDNTDIMNTVNLVKKENNLKNINLITIGQELKLPEQLRLNNVTIFGENNEEVLKSNQRNYYRANDVFGDTATKKQEFPNQGFVESALNLKTKATEYVESVVINVRGFFTNETSRDAKMADIFAKQIGTWTKDGETIGGGYKLEHSNVYIDKNGKEVTLEYAQAHPDECTEKPTDAYKFALSMNNDDYTTRETEYKGKKETHAYFENTKSDNNVTLFATEEVNGEEYIAMRDKENKVHYFDKSDNLKEVIFD